MKPVDKFGNPIYAKTYEMMLGFGCLLTKHGYVESFEKPNLFYRKAEDGTVYFADMRGTDIVAIWEDPSPLFYAQFPDNMPYWQRSRLASMEFSDLEICRLSFEFDPEEYCIVANDLGIYMSNSSLGWCDWCGKDFQRDGHFCCAECEQAHNDYYTKMLIEHCKICNKELGDKEEIRHHVNYKENITISICRSCHLKIHRGKSLSDYIPVDAPQKPKYLLSM
jgi:hypothetical protein